MPACGRTSGVPDGGSILHADFDFSMRGSGNLYGALNDRGRSITLAR
jgi:hypothetical protein